MAKTPPTCPFLPIGEAVHCFVLYDIQDDKKRIKLADACLDYGLDRVQYSAFRGQLTATLRNELTARLRRIVGKAPANVQVIGICDKDWQERVEIANPGLNLTPPTQQPTELDDD